MSSEQSQYYLDHKEEFFQEYGHEVLVEKLKKCIKIVVDSPVISIDVGSNVGTYTQNLIGLCPEENHKILSFEPNPVNTPLLVENTKHLDNIVIYNEAVSDVKGSVPFYNYKHCHGNRPGNTIAGLSPGGEFICDVNVYTLDEKLENFPDGVIKFIKIDTEGNDTKVLRGLEKNLERTMYIIFEASDCLVDSRGPGEATPLYNCTKFLSGNGFDTYRIGTKRLLKINDDGWDDVYDKVLYHSNCFAIKKNDPLIHELIDVYGYYV
jgi:FkbM family methyltransferase